MTVRIGEILFYGWESLELPGGWSDTFIFRMSPLDGLPPADYARVIRSVIPPVLRLRKTASLWVQVGGEPGDPSGEGGWFAQEVRYALRGLSAPVAVTSASTRPQIWDFSFFPWVDSEPLPRPPQAQPYLKGKGLLSSEKSCLRVLARADCAFTAEIASLADVRITTARLALHSLEEHRLVALSREGRYPFWRIRRSGLSLALRSWGLPPGRAFLRRRERGRSACKERAVARKKWRSSAGRHRRTARLWPAWLRRAWPRAVIWAGWSEVALGRERSRPDALCWGMLEGCETLFWLEVEGGNVSREVLRRKTLRRVNRALVYARGYKVRLLFALLGLPWVRRDVVEVFHDLPGDVAVVLEDWKEFGRLPVPGWGKVKWK